MSHEELQHTLHPSFRFGVPWKSQAPLQELLSCLAGRLNKEEQGAAACWRELRRSSNAQLKTGCPSYPLNKVSVTAAIASSFVKELCTDSTKGRPSFSFGQSPECISDPGISSVSGSEQQAPEDLSRTDNRQKGPKPLNGRSLGSQRPGFQGRSGLCKEARLCRKPLNRQCFRRRKATARNSSKSVKCRPKWLGQAGDPPPRTHLK